MIQNFKRSEIKEILECEVAFDDGRGNGFSFPCDEEGNLLEMTEAAKKNYGYCMQHPEKFFRWNKILKRRRYVRGSNSGTCRCGTDIELYNQYCGACECPNCGQWYNTSGQELLPPDKWGWDGTPW